MSIEFEIIMIGLLILANGVFALSEMAVVTARKSRLQDWERKGNRGAEVALELAEKPNQLLSSVQIGITLIGILAGTFAGGSIADWMASYVKQVPLIAAYHQQIGLGVVVLIITYFSLVIGELVPKRLAMRHPETLATWVARPLRLFSWATAPMVYLLSFSTDLVTRLFGKAPANEPPVTEEEIKSLVQQGAEAGVFDEEAEDLVGAVLRLGEKKARSLMTPRTQISWIDANSSADEIRGKLAATGHSRIPVAAGNLDNVQGVVQAKQLLAQALTDQVLDLTAMMQQPLFVPRTISALELLDSFKKSNNHIALVVDEYGGIEGLVTHHDILEAIAGDIPIGERPADPKAVQRHDGSWLLDGMLSIDEFKEIFHLENLPGEKRDAFQTLGGFVFTQMGRLPAVAESFDWQGLRFEIVDMDGKRIDKLLVRAVSAIGTEKKPGALDSEF